MRGGHHRALPAKAGPGRAPREEAGPLTLEFQVCGLSNASCEFLRKRRCGRRPEIAGVRRFKRKPEFRKESHSGRGSRDGGSLEAKVLLASAVISAALSASPPPSVLIPRGRGCSLTCPMAVRVQGGYGM